MRYASCRRAPTPPQTVLLVGHNPGVHQLVLELTDGDQLPGFPPSALAVLALDVDEWSEAETGVGRLTALHLPDQPDAASSARTD